MIPQKKTLGRTLGKPRADYDWHIPVKLQLAMDLEWF